LTVVAEDSASGGAQVGWWIFKAKADVSAKDVTTHKVKLTLNTGDIEVGSSTTTR
jgi:Trypsin-co-occurring domain 2